MRRAIALLTATSLCACAQTYDPIIDAKNVDPAKYQQDLAECRQYAEQVSPVDEAIFAAFAGAALGAALGAATGAIAGNAGQGAAIGAAAGGITGVAGGALHGGQAQQDVIRQCLQGRGYSLLY
jgi:hypothetical protein